MKKRVVVTGMGAITPIGNSVEEFWKNVKKNVVGFGPITKVDSMKHKVKLVAEVENFDPRDYMDFKSAKRMEPFSQYAVAASKEALENSGLDLEKEDPYRIGVSIGSGIGGIGLIEHESKKVHEDPPVRLVPLSIPMMINNMAAGNVAIRFGLMGKNINVVTACATGTNCIGEAFRSIQYGEVDVMLAGGTESTICNLPIYGFQALNTLSLSTDPNRASIPFDKERAGFVMGEGAGVLVLESLEHALARNAVILAEIAGYASTADAYHITSPSDSGDGAKKAMELAIKDAGVTPQEIDYINAHGTSTKPNDLSESRAIFSLFSQTNRDVKVSSTKSMIGHLLGAAGGVEAIVCIKSILEGYIHPNVGLKVKDEELAEINLVVGDGLSTKVDCTLSNSFGFGGHNACIVFKKYQQ
ncbi:3-oxoacyl-[acyl-carrier-protein] synthase 2 [Clostridia bacterium]|nr:3-oxoacyl-[acyl-carrier-protein] synthase 2 [Clostridia bacterium]